MTDYDIIIIGAGPIGLAFAQSVANEKIRVLVLEKAPLIAIKNPKEDGREIALTHSSVDILKKLTAWQHLPKEHISFIKKATVFNADSDDELCFDADQENVENLGYLIPNYLIRRSLFTPVATNPFITLKTDVSVDTFSYSDGNVQDIQNIQVHLTDKQADKQTISAHLLVAADSRFSTMRQKMGITAHMKDFSRVMLVCQMKHTKAHNHVASEYFYYEYIIATLPMPNQCSSIVMTLTKDQADKALKMNHDEFNQYVSSALNGKLGEMELIGERHHYPLMGVYSDTFVRPNFALIGDAAVGMHPVTAHGFNLGLRGQDILTQTIHRAKRRYQDIGSLPTLNSYQYKYRLVSKTMYIGTNSIVWLFTQNAPIMRHLRKLTLDASIHLPPIRKLISAHLTERYRQPRNLFPFL